MTTIHWDSRNAWGLMPPRAVQLWCIYAAMVNRDGVAWPSLAHLTSALRLKDKSSAIEARRWLIEHNALEIVRGYVPPSERRMAASHDQRYFVRLTGTVEIEGVTYSLLYAPGDEAGAENWRGAENQTLVGKIAPPQSENPNHPQSEKSDPNVVPIEDSQLVAAPTFEPLPIRMLRNDTLAHTNGWTLVQAYSDATNIPSETIHAAPGAPKVAAGLSRAGINAEDVTAFMAELRTKPDRWNGYRFNYLAEDLPRWKQQRTEQPAAPRVLSDIERAALDKQREAEQRQWWIEQGLL